MTILNPTRGEILDRLSIVQRRLLEREVAGLPWDHVAQELEELLRALAADETTQQQIRLTSSLAAVNAALWERENRLRELIPKPTTNKLKPWSPEVEAQDLAFQIARLNDTRSGLIAEIDGVESPKLFWPGP
jgi:hypothetical protein